MAGARPIRIIPPSRLALALVAAAVGISGPAGSAAAFDNTVGVQVCGPQEVNHALSPVADGADPFVFDDPTHCPAGVRNGPAMPASATGGYAASAPAGTVIARAWLSLTSSAGDGSGGWQVQVRGFDPDGTLHLIYGCGYGAPGGCSTDPFSVQVNAGALTSLQVVLLCVAPACAAKNYLDIDSARLDIADPNPPRLLRRSGPVWAQHVWHHASDLLAGTVGNGAEGIAAVTATLDGAPTTVGVPCDYTRLTVCPDATLSTPLAAATDGTHHLAIAATTAAGITSTLYDDPSYQIDSNPPTAPLNVTLDPPGDRYAPAATRMLSWTNPTGQVAPITHAVIHVCRLDSGQCRDETADGPNVQQATITPWAGGGAYRLTVVLQDAAGNIDDGPGGRSAPVMLRYDQRPFSALLISTNPLRVACPRAPTGHPRPRALSARRRGGGACRVVARHAGRAVRARFGAPVTVYAALMAMTGHPLANEPIQVLQQLRGPATTFTAAGTATTDAAGLLTYRIAPGPSRTLRLAYPGSDAIRAAAADLDIRVPAFSSFHVDRRTAHLNHPVVFSGQVEGGPIPKGGVAVQLEGRDYRTGWIPVSPAGKLRTDASGHWRYRFAAHRQSGRRFTYPFRASILADPLFPYLPSTTKPKLLTILNP